MSEEKKTKTKKTLECQFFFASGTFEARWRNPGPKNIVSVASMSKYFDCGQFMQTTVQSNAEAYHYKLYQKNSVTLVYVSELQMG